MAKPRSATAKPAPAKKSMPLPGIVRRYIDTWRSILILARRPDESEFSLLLRLNLLGFLIVGGIGFIIHLIYVLLSS